MDSALEESIYETHIYCFLKEESPVSETYLLYVPSTELL